MKTLNERFSALSMRRRYEVWFLRLGLGDGSGAWWFRYLLMNPGRGGCPSEPLGQPVQVWATWFPRVGKPERVIQGFRIESLRSNDGDLNSAGSKSAGSNKTGLSNVGLGKAGLSDASSGYAGLSKRGASPFFLEIAENRIGEIECRGRIAVGDQRICWDLRYQSSFRAQLSGKGWIGFSRTPHSDAVFSGEIALNDRTFRGEPLGYGMQGHNCGYRHRHFWSWTHIHFPCARCPGSTFEALAYELPLGRMFRMPLLCHDEQRYTFRSLTESVRDSRQLSWKLECTDARGAHVEVRVSGLERFVHRVLCGK